MTNDFVHNAILRIDESEERVLRCLDMLDYDKVWAKPNSVSNSIGNLVLHLIGNVTQYIHSGLGKAPDHRERSLEFLEKSAIPLEDLKHKFATCIAGAKEIINSVTKEQFEANYSVQGFSLTGVGIVVHVVEHLSYHTGQIALLCKLHTNRDLGFYDGLDLEVTG